MISSTGTSPRFALLEHAGFRRLKHAAYLKGLLRPFKGKGELEIWASECFALRDELIEIATEHVLAQAQAYPFSRLSAHLALQKTGAGTTFRFTLPLPKRPRPESDQAARESIAAPDSDSGKAA